MAHIHGKTARHLAFHDPGQNAVVGCATVEDFVRDRPVGCVVIGTHGGVCRLTCANMRTLAKWLEARVGEIEEAGQRVEYAEDKPIKPRTTRA